MLLSEINLVLKNEINDVKRNIIFQQYVPYVVVNVGRPCYQYLSIIY